MQKELEFRTNPEATLSVEDEPAELKYTRPPNFFEVDTDTEGSHSNETCERQLNSFFLEKGNLRKEINGIVRDFNAIQKEVSLTHDQLVKLQTLSAKWRMELDDAFPRPLRRRLIQRLIN